MWSHKKRRKRMFRRSSKNKDDSDSDSDDDCSVQQAQNHIYFWADVTKKSCLDLISSLNKVHMNLRPYSLCGDDPIPIYIHINSYGGDTDAALGVIDTMESLKEQGAKIITIVEGNASSAATLISVAGTERRIRPNAYLRIHNFSAGLWGKKNDLDEEHKNLGKMEEVLVNFYKANTDMSKPQLRKLLSREIDLLPSECIEKGLVDEIQQ